MSNTRTGMPTRRRRFSQLAGLLGGLSLISLVLVSAPAQADPESPPGAARATGWYLALGDSVAAGYQPGAGDDREGGYVGPVLAAEQDETGKTHLRNLACSGETSTTMVAGGRCAYEEGSQLAQALVFLRAHSVTTRLVTLTIGANDVTPCLNPPDPASIQACLAAKLNTYATNLAAIESQIHAAAPGARLVVTNYYNPYLALWFSNPALANLTTTLQGQLNGVISTVTTLPPPGFGAVADVASAFRSTDTTPVAFDGYPTPVPTNVTVVCTLTWMCSKGDIHPNDAGYATIASAVIAKLS